MVLRPSEDDPWQLVLVDSSTDALLGYMAVGDPLACGDDTAEVVGAGAVGGWGPAVYDTALEFVGRRGWWLTPDRRSISDNAIPVWDFYATKRGDVESEPLGDHIACPTYQVPELDSRYRFRKGAKVEGPLAPDRGRKLERMTEIGDALVRRRAEKAGKTQTEIRRQVAAQALEHFSTIYRELVRGGLPREHAYSVLDVAYLAGLAFVGGAAVAAVPALVANPKRTQALRRRLLR